MSVCVSLSLFNLSVLYWHDKNYTFALPKQLQLGCSQVVHKSLSLSVCVCVCLSLSLSLSLCVCVCVCVCV